MYNDCLNSPTDGNGNVIKPIPAYSGSPINQNVILKPVEGWLSGPDVPLTSTAAMIAQMPFTSNGCGCSKPAANTNYAANMPRPGRSNPPANVNKYAANMPAATAKYVVPNNVNNARLPVAANNLMMNKKLTT